MKELTYQRYLDIFKNVEKGHFGEWEYYTENKLDVSIDEVAEDLQSCTNSMMLLAKFYGLLKVLLFGNRAITFDEYRTELYEFNKVHIQFNADEMYEYIIQVLIKYIN